MDRAAALPTELRFAVKQMATLSAAEIAKRRLEFFLYWNRRAKELEQKEQDVRSSMDSVVNNAVKSKKLALFKEILEFYNYPDKGVADELVHGATLVGEVQQTGMRPLKFTPALLTEDALVTHSKLRRPLIEKDCPAAGDAEIDKEVWSRLLRSVKKGGLLDHSLLNKFLFLRPFRRDLD